MILWRLCRQAHADLHGQAGVLAAGRWHSQGQAVTYTAAGPALCALEMRVNLGLNFEDIPRDYVLVCITAVKASVEQVEQLPENPRGFGDAWLREGRTALLSVPSVLVPMTRNVLLNPAHPDAALLEITSITPFQIDTKLLHNA